MYTTIERQNYVNLIVELLSKNKNVDALFLVGSLGNGTQDDYSDVDITVIVKDGFVKKTYSNFEKHIKQKFDCFKYFKMEYNPNSLLYGIFTNSALEIDLGFNNLENFNLTKSKKQNANIKLLYCAPNFSLPKVKPVKQNKTNLILERNGDMWYNFKNCIFALKRKKLFRAINELDEIRNQIIELYAQIYGLTFKHYRNLDNFNDAIKSKIKKLFPTEISLNGIKQPLVYSINLFCEILKENGLTIDALNYKKLFNSLIKDVKL